MKISTIIFVVISLLLCASCISDSEKEYYKRKIKTNQDSIDACTNAGGVPILSIWDGRLKDCIFPPCKEKE